MNFTIKYHKPAQAVMCLMGKPFSNWNSSYAFSSASPFKVCSYKATDYETTSEIYDQLLHGSNLYGGDSASTAINTTQANTTPFWGLTAYASSEKIANFNEDAYKVESQVGTATQSFSYGYTNNTYSVSVSNVSGQSDIKVNCIKFTKVLYEKPANSTPAYSAVSHTCLMYSCYLDEEVTIPAGSEKVFVVNFSFINA